LIKTGDYKMKNLSLLTIFWYFTAISYLEIRFFTFLVLILWRRWPSRSGNSVVKKFEFRTDKESIKASFGGLFYLTNNPKLKRQITNKSQIQNIEFPIAVILTHFGIRI